MADDLGKRIEEVVRAGRLDDAAGGILRTLGDRVAALEKAAKGHGGIRPLLVLPSAVNLTDGQDVAFAPGPPPTYGPVSVTTSGPALSVTYQVDDNALNSATKTDGAGLVWSLTLQDGDCPMGWHTLMICAYDSTGVGSTPYRINRTA